MVGLDGSAIVSLRSGQFQTSPHSTYRSTDLLFLNVLTICQGRNVATFECVKTAN